jgi:hypothetical protein
VRGASDAAGLAIGLTPFIRKACRDFCEPFLCFDGALFSRSFSHLESIVQYLTNRTTATSTAALELERTRPESPERNQALDKRRVLCAKCTGRERKEKKLISVQVCVVWFEFFIGLGSGSGSGSAFEFRG